MFGMGTGVAPPLWSPDVDFYFNISRDGMQPRGLHRAHALVLSLSRARGVAVGRATPAGGGGAPLHIGDAFEG